MAPWSSRNRDAQDTVQRSDMPTSTAERERHEHNPFVAFRHAIDDQFRGFANFFNPGGALEPTDSRWRRASSFDDNDPSEPFTALRHTGSMFGFVPLSRNGIHNDSLAAARSVLLQARDANARDRVRSDAILALYRDRDDLGPFGLPLLFSDHVHYPWLSVRWFLNSAYSPTRLEVHRHCHQHGSMWRAAFEDLLNESLGKKMEAHDAWTNRINNQGLYLAWAARPQDWMLGLQCRGVLPPQLPSLYELDRHDADNVFAHVVKGQDADHRTRMLALGAELDVLELANKIGSFDEDERAEQYETHAKAYQQPVSEMDAYEHFLGRANNQQTSASHHQSSAVPKPTQATPPSSLSSTAAQPASISNPALPASKILSTLSTTETTTLPDGTVTTKVLLRRRFADGREESSETVTMSNVARHLHDPSLTSVDDASRSQLGRSDNSAGQNSSAANNTAMAVEHAASPGKKASRSWFWN